jgi:hypothetical protein
MADTFDDLYYKALTAAESGKESNVFSSRTANLMGSQARGIIRYVPFHQLSKEDQKRATAKYVHKNAGEMYDFKDEHYFYPIDRNGRLFSGRDARRTLGINQAGIRNEEFMKSIGYQKNPGWDNDSRKLMEHSRKLDLNWLIVHEPEFPGGNTAFILIAENNRIAKPPRQVIGETYEEAIETMNLTAQSKKAKPKALPMKRNQTLPPLYDRHGEIWHQVTADGHILESAESGERYSRAHIEKYHGPLTSKK